jgi:Tfp pilus assembly protein PilF
MSGAILATLVASAALAAAQAPSSGPFANRYQAIVAAYRGGNREMAVRQLLQLNPGQVERVVTRATVRADRREPDKLVVDGAFLRAAALLHAEAAFSCWRTGPMREGAAQLDLGRRLADATDPEQGPPGSFRRRWYLATALIGARLVLPDEAIQHFDRAIQALPDDAALLAAAGWFAERVATAAAGARVGPDQLRLLTARFRQAAEGYLTRALKLQPADAAPALRLARLAVLAGDDRQARERLAALVARRELEPAIAYVARLLLGGIHERAGERAAAESAYREAIALNARAQSARLALGHLLYAHGDAAAAAAIVEGFVGSSSPVHDPWASYQLAYLPIGAAMFEELVEEVQQ